MCFFFNATFCYGVMNPLEERSVTVVGICNGDNGRTCDNHRICGETMTVGTIVRFLITIVNRCGKMEYAIGAYRVDKGKTSCLVGFLPYINVKDWKAYEDEIGQVVEINKKSISYGSCSVTIIPKQIGYHYDLYQPELPKLGIKTIDPEHASVFFGNKDAVKYYKYHNES